MPAARYDMIARVTPNAAKPLITASLSEHHNLAAPIITAPQFSEIKTKTHLERWVLNCAIGTMFLSLRVLRVPFDIVNIVKYRVIS